MKAVHRVGAYLQVRDGDGCRHLLHVSSVQAVSGTDLMRNETFITAAGRTIRVPQPLGEIMPLISPGDRLPTEGEFEPWPLGTTNQPAVAPLGHASNPASVGPFLG